MIVIFDLDGTLANIEHRRHWLDAETHPELSSDERWRSFFAACPHDEPNERLIQLTWIFNSAGYGVIIFSGRSDEVREETEAWLRRHVVYYDELRMRPAGDYSPDEELKRRWLEGMDRSKILAVFDDRQKVVDMWRAEGLLCCQVAPGGF